VNSSSRLRLIVNHAGSGLLGLAGALLVLLSTSHYGAGLDPDGVAYIGTARNIAQGLGALSYGGNPMVLQPPFYPFVLALLDRLLGVDPLASTAVVTAFVFGFTIYVSGWLFSSLLGRPRVYALVGAAWVLASPALFGVAVWAYSEPLFDLLAVLSLLGLTRWLQRRRGIWFALLIVSAALACLTRYAGVTLILAEGVAILLLEKEKVTVKIAHTVLYGLGAGVPVALWMVRNRLVSGTLLGPRAPAAYGLIQVLQVAFKTLSAWYLPGTILGSRSLLFLFALAIGFLAGLGLRDGRAALRAFRPQAERAAPLLLFVVTYLAFMVISSVATDVSPLRDRLLSPIYVPLTLLLLLLVDRLLAPLGEGLTRRFPGTLAVLIVGLWLIYPLHTIRSDVQTGLDQGWGYSDRLWKGSPTVRYLLQAPPPASQEIYSNGPDVLYILDHLQSKLSPLRTMDTSGQIPVASPVAENLSRVSAIWPGSNGGYLVWFDNISRDYLYSLSDLQRAANLQPIERFGDGAIYLVSRKP